MAQTLTSTTDSQEVVAAVLAGETPPEPTPAPEEPSGPPAETTIETPPEPKPATPETPPTKPEETPPPAAAKPKDEPGPGTEAGRALARLRWGQEGQHNAEGRIAKLIAERKERDERITKLEADIARAQEQLRTPPPAAPKPAEVPPSPAAETAASKPKPKQDDFESYDAFTEALADWKVETRLEQERKSLREEVENRFAREERAREAEREGRLLEERRQKFVASQNEAKTRHEDYEETMKANSGLEIGATAVRYCQESDLGPEIVYFLAKHPDIADELNRARPHEALVRIGKIEAIIESQFDDTGEPAPATTAAAALTSSESPRVSISRAPSPAPRVEGGVVVPEKDPSKMTHAEYRAFRAKQQARRAG